MLAGLETISGGEVRIGDKIVNNLAPKSRGIAMVFQNYALYPHMTVHAKPRLRPQAEQAAEGANRQTGGRSGENSRTGRTARSPAAPALQARPGAARGGGPGDRQKPDVFLFDEPLSNLDAKLRASMRIRISDLHKQLKNLANRRPPSTSPYDQTEAAMTMGDRICVMKLGAHYAG